MNNTTQIREAVKDLHGTSKMALIAIAGKEGVKLNGASSRMSADDIRHLIGKKRVASIPAGLDTAH